MFYIGFSFGLAFVEGHQMNYIFIICTENYLPYAKKCLDSLPKNWNFNEYRIIFKFYNSIDLDKIDLGELFHQVQFEAIPYKDWNDQIAYRKAMLLYEFAMKELKTGDKVIVCDADLKFKIDPFDIFLSNSDVYYTTRHYDYHFPVNEGFWGFRWNDRTKKFIEFYKEEIENPTWDPYIRWLKKYWHWGQKNWGIGQDFFCTIYEYMHVYGANVSRLILDNDCIFEILGPNYNFCPSVEENDLERTLDKATKEMRWAENNSDVKILHYKGRLKELM